MKKNCTIFINIINDISNKGKDHVEREKKAKILYIKS